MRKASELHHVLSEKVATVLPKSDWRKYLRDALFRTLDKRSEAIQLLAPDFEKFRHEAREAKAHAVNNLDKLLQQFIQNCEKRGTRVYVAKDAEDACRIVYRIAEQKNARLITKSKSMTTEEIGLNQFLEKHGLKVVDTDLGELIVQLAGERPFHLVYPAVHKTRQDVAELFSREAGRKLSDDISELMNFAREYLRERFLTADLAITGVNIAIAETGTVIVETNEGNDRLGNIPAKTYIAVMGMEKLVEKIEDALKLIVAHPVSSTGQWLTNYVSFLSGRTPLAGHAEEREMHIVIVDNGRSSMRDDPVFREALYCIRCGACMNICPTYSSLGGHVFGHIYTGPIGIPWTAFVHGLEKAAEFAPLCISCGLCKEICPTIIDMPYMIAEVKHRYVQKGGQLFVNKVVESYETAYRMGSKFPRLFNTLISSTITRLFMEKFLGIERRRTLPRVAAKPLDKLLRGKVVENGADAVFFADFFARYLRPDIGAKAVDALIQAGYRVSLPPQRSSGYPYFAYGDLDKARKLAEYNVGNLSKALGDGAVIVSIEPTATYTLKHLYPKLLNHSPDAEKVSEATTSLTMLLHNLLIDGRLEAKPMMEGRAAVHIPCHERAFNSCREVVALLNTAGIDATVVETGTCCGMAGTFGMKHGVLGYELSNVVGEELFSRMKASGCSYVVSTSSVCKIHISDGTALPVYHPLETLEFTAPRKR